VAIGHIDSLVSRPDAATLEVRPVFDIVDRRSKVSYVDIRRSREV